MEKLLSLEEAAEILGVEYKTVYRLVRAGQIPAGRVGRVYRIKRSDLDFYFESTKPDGGRAVPAALRGLRCCVTGDRIVSDQGIGGFASDTGDPICEKAWRAGWRTSKPATTNGTDKHETDKPGTSPESASGRGAIAARGPRSAESNDERRT